jgi:hypothetical protein
MLFFIRVKVNKKPHPCGMRPLNKKHQLQL